MVSMTPLRALEVAVARGGHDLTREDRSRVLGLSDCEAVADGLLAQPVAAVTSLAFVGAAGWLLRRSCRTPSTSPRPVLAHGAILGLVGLGSVAYHGPQLPGSQLLHDGSIAALVLASAAVPLARRVRGRPVLAPGGGRYARLAALALACALPAYVLGRTGGPLCRPESLLQLHGLWHVLAAVAAASWAAALWLGCRHPLGDAAVGTTSPRGKPGQRT